MEQGEDLVKSWLDKNRKPVLSYFNVCAFKSKPSRKSEAILRSGRAATSHFGGVKNLCRRCFPNEPRFDESAGQILDLNQLPITTVVSRLQLKPEGTPPPWLADLRYTLKRKTNQNYPEFWKEVLDSPRVQNGIERALAQEEVLLVPDEKKKSVCRKNFWSTAKRYLECMRARISVFIIRLTGYCCFKVFRRFLSGILVSQQQMDELKKITQLKLPIVYLPQHRSHLDYILITFALWHWDIRIPHVASGDNLNLSGFGWLLKALGGFFIRRKMDESRDRRDFVYRAVLQSYMTELLKSGEQIEFFAEGGRSRTGKPLLPKSGLLSIVVDAYVDGAVPDVYLVPVSYTYEKLLEGGFASELLGQPKQRESFWSVVKNTWRASKNHYGFVRLDFGQPVSLKEFLKVLRSKGNVSFADFPKKDESFTTEQIRMTAEPSSFFQSNPVSNSTPDSRFLIRAVCEHMCYEANENAALTTSQLLAALLLGKYRAGGSVEDLGMDFVWLGRELLKRKRDIIGFDPTDEFTLVSDVVLRAADLLGERLVEILNWIQVKESGFGDSDSGIGAEEDTGVALIPSSKLRDRVLLSYYKNGVLTALALDCVIATAMLSMTEDAGSSFREDDLVERCLQLCDILRFEFMLFRPCESPREKIGEMISEHFASGPSCVVWRQKVKVRGGEEVVMEVTEDEDWDSEELKPSGILSETERDLMETLAHEFAAAEEEDSDGDLSGGLELVKTEQELPEDEGIQEICILSILKRDIQFSKSVLDFYKSLLAPIIQSYYWEAIQLQELMAEDSIMEENEFVLAVQKSATEQFSSHDSGYYLEAANTESFRNALKLFVDRRIVCNQVGEAGTKIFLDPVCVQGGQLSQLLDEFRIFL